ncbi:unnamed protein product [Coffea canephora]|uniref:DH200=94 genomic scaffold, scaffold_2294 n=1 Tax=Coffea canephora TaxID=49390 RepID=A0A068VJY8_COFCA|nr:unnamed protein product [Coffea canephora]
MAKCISILSILFLSILCHFTPNIAAYNVVHFGSRGDGRTDSTLPFLRAWMSACSSARPATVYVPRGTFLMKTVTFSGPCRCRIRFQIDGTLVAPNKHRALGNSGSWILFHNVSRLTIYGGTVDARGAGFWACRKNGRNCPAGASILSVCVNRISSMSLIWCNNVLVSGLKSVNSQTMHMAIGHCSNVKIQNVKIIAPSGSPNTDGIHVESSIGVSILDSIIRTGDDCISIGPGSMNLWISRIGCGPGHGIR